MKTQLLKKLLIAFALFVSLMSFAQPQQTFDLTMASVVNDFDAEQPNVSISSTVDGLRLEETGDLTLQGMMITFPDRDDEYNTVVITLAENMTTSTQVRFRGSGDGTVNPTIPASTQNPGEGWTTVTLGGGESEAFSATEPLFVQFRDNSNPKQITLGQFIVIESIVFSDQRALSVSENIFKQMLVTGAKGHVDIRNAPQGSEIKLYTITGQEVKNANLSSGLYIVNVKAEAQNISKKVIVQ